MEKQRKIVEMAKDICRVKLNCNDVCNPISACNALKYAERAVEAGYSKQKEGKWLVEKFKNGDMFINCSVCKSVIDCNYTNIDENEFDYCPYCGAKMKGGD